MGSGAKMALGLLILFIALFLFYFAFHPNGATLNGAPVANPSEAFQFVLNEFAGAGNGGSSSAAPNNNNATTGPNNAGSAPTPTGS